MSVLLLDQPGGVGDALAAALRAEGTSVVLAVDADLSNMRAVRARVLAARPTAIVVLSTWDDIAACEADPDRAFARNAEDLIHVAAAALEARATPVLLSPAELYGQSGGPFGEDEVPQPTCAWASTRLRGETLLARAARQALIIRSGPLLAPRRAAWGALGVPDEGLADPIAPADLGHAIARLLDTSSAGLFHLGHPDPIDTRPTRRQLAGLLGAPTTPTRVRLGRGPVLFGDKLRPLLHRAPRAWREVDLTASAAVREVATMGHRQDVRRVDKPWGHEIIWAVSERYVGKVLFIRAGERLSLQYHEKKDETVYVLSGKMLFEVGPLEPEGTPREDVVMKAGDAYRITPHTVHRMVAIEDTQVLEASTPELDDVVRLEDKYGREGTSAP